MITFRCREQAAGKGKPAQRRGASAVEMAFVLPVFVTLVLGMIEVGRGIMVAQLLENAAREGARMSILDNTTNAQVTSSAQTFMQSAAGVALGDTTVVINVAGSNGAALSSAKPGDLITVTCSIPFSKVSWLPPNYLAGMNLSALSAMRHE
jgi:Flp pilus assembly protein TadG